MKNNKHKSLLATIVLSILFVSCDKSNDFPDNQLSGKLIPVSIRSLEVAGGGEEMEVRSASQREAERVSTAIGDGLLLEMSMEREESALRLVGDGDTHSLADNAKFRVIAVLHDNINNNKYVSHGDFTYTTGPTEFHSIAPFHVEAGYSYDFVCISYNDGDLPATTGYTKGSVLPALSIDNHSKENVLWWKNSTAIAISSEEDTYLSITLKQRLAKVRVVLDCSYNGWKITNIDASKSITMGSVVNGTMNLVTGAMGTASGNQTITWPSTLVAGDEAIRQPSNGFYVIPKSVSVTVPAEALTVDGNANRTKIPVTGGTGTFATALVSGGNYKLYVKLKTPIWARSNIYWDNSTQKLTFVPAAANPQDNDDTKRGYQGVFFRFGSLVGISPVGDYDDNTVLYVPYDYPVNSRWKGRVRTEVKADTDIPAATDNWTTWGSNTAEATDIPYMDPVNFNEGTTAWDNAYVIDGLRNTQEKYQSLRGDICQYLGATAADTEEGRKLKGYRLPTANECGQNDVVSWTGRTDGWAPAPGGFPAQTTNDADGTANMISASSNQSYAKNTIMGDVTLPASGCLNATGGLFYVGTYGIYRTGSARGTANGYYLLFKNIDLSSTYANVRSYGISVRCVKN
jgi:hypothetical protein